MFRGTNYIIAKKCGRCQGAYYCSKQCQKEAYSIHKEYCLEYKQLYNKMKKEENTLNRENYFAPENIGHFWSLFDPRDYWSSLCIGRTYIS